MNIIEKKINIGSVSIIDSIVPDSHQSVDLVLQNVELDDVYIFELNPGETKPNRSIHIHSGRLTALVAPVTGEKRSSPGAFDIATSIAEIERVRLRTTYLKAIVIRLSALIFPQPVLL